MLIVSVVAMHRRLAHIILTPDPCQCSVDKKDEGCGTGSIGGTKAEIKHNEDTM